MNITPDTTIRLLKCPLELDNKNQITFSNATAQYNYFHGLPYIEVDGSYYQRKDSSIYYPDNFDDLLEYNYVMYQNSNYSNKWFYAFITNMEYVSDNCTRIEITTDVFQTWQFDLTYKKSFVIREHVNDDTIGSNIIEENLDTGEMTTINSSSVKYGITGTKIIVMSTYDPYAASGTNPDFNGLIAYNGTMFGCPMWAFDYNDLAGVQNFIQLVISARSTSAIQGIFMCPTELIRNNINSLDHNKITGSYSVYTNTETFLPKSNTAAYSDYTPKNNKCYCYPYHFLEVTNSNGEKQQYRIEDFTKNQLGQVEFTNYMALQIGISGRLCPKNYRGSQLPEYNSDVSVNLPKFPTCQWSSDYYTNWLTQNSVNMIRTIANTNVGIDASLLTKAGSAADVMGSSGASGGSAASSVTDLIGKHMQARLNANQVAGNNTGDVSFSMGVNGYTFLEKRCKLQNLKIIDDYFTMFGYKVNSLKVPNTTGRSNWNYVETNNINIVADIPQEDLQMIKSFFNNGITLWHTTTYFLDYSQTNSIVS